MKYKFGATGKGRDQQLLDFITIDVIKIKHQRPSSKDIITIHTTPIINRSFKKHPISWELIHRLLIRPLCKCHKRNATSSNPKRPTRKLS